MTEPRERPPFECRFCQGRGEVAGSRCQACGGSGNEAERKAAA